jgi:hypothetical protein
MLHHWVMAFARRRLQSGEFVREPSLEERLDQASDRESRESQGDLLDVPATVVCARCGDADCTGCEGALSRSGIVSIVAWERPDAPSLTRLWSTARSATRDAEAFFELMPDGPLLPALRFAALCELLATSILVVAFVVVAMIVAPDVVRELVRDPYTRGRIIRSLVVGWPAFAMLAVVAHAAHGLSVDLGARRQGSKSARTRALRFGLYACGWDLVMGPIGAVVVAFKEGFRAAARLPSDLSGLPTRCTIAFLRGAYRLDGERARTALGVSYFGAGAATLAVAITVILALGALVFL